MELRIHNYFVQNIQFGKETTLQKGILTINKEEALAVVKKDKHIIEADLYIANPGDQIRIVPVKDAIEPRYVENRCLFPGVTGDLSKTGNGTTLALKNMSIIVAGKEYGGFQDGLIDMWGEGAKYTLFSQLKNLVLVASTDEYFEKNNQQKKNHALRWAGLRLAEYIGKAAQEIIPDEMETFALKPITKRENEKKLPGIVLILQPQSQMEEPGYNTLVYGWDANHMLPTFMHPNEILDGTIISGSFMPSSSKWSTYDYQNFPMIKSLYEEHGKTINFLGVIVSNLNVALEQKERAALFVAQLAQTLGADGAVIAEEGYGNPDTDFIACIVALENAGIQTVGLTNECTGRDGGSQPLVSLDQRATAIVSCGNVSEIIKLKPMETVLGNLHSLADDGLSGGWANDEILGSSVKEDGSIILENNAMFCGDQVTGWSYKSMAEF